MEKSYEKKYHKLEEKNWWFISRRDIIFFLIKKMDLPKDAKILEIGCSGGSLMKILNENGYHNITGIDISEDAINLCKERGVDAKVMDGAKILFEDNKFDLIIASDILEHIKNEGAALSEWNRVLKTSGKLIIFVPAFNLLWSKHDEINKHYRRYDKEELSKKLKGADFKLYKSSYWNFFLFFPLCFINIFEHFLKKPKDHLRELNPLINKALIILLKIEKFFLNYRSLPIGVSVFIIGIKK